MGRLVIAKGTIEKVSIKRNPASINQMPGPKTSNTKSTGRLNFPGRFEENEEKGSNISVITK